MYCTSLSTLSRGPIFASLLGPILNLCLHSPIFGSRIRQEIFQRLSCKVRHTKIASIQSPLNRVHAMAAQVRGEARHPGSATPALGREGASCREQRNAAELRVDRVRIEQMVRDVFAGVRRVA